MSYDLCEKYKIGRILLRQDVSLNEKLQDVVNILEDCLKVKKCSIMIINPEDLTLEVKASTNPEIVGHKRNLSDVTISTRALIDDEPFYTDEKRLEFFSPLDSSKYKSGNSLSIPIKYLGKKLGVVNLADTEGGTPFTKDHENTSVDIVEHLAPFIYAAQAKDLLEKKVKKLEDVNRRFMEMDDLKTNLTNFIVHDLKGPISTITANLDLLTYEPLTEEQFEYLNLAIEDTYKLQRMMLNILDVSKLQEGKIKVFREETDIYELAKNEVSSFKNSAARKDIALALNGSSRMCYIDENLIGRVLSNLLLNAIEHSPEGSKITIDLRHDGIGKELSVSVSDEGIGIPDELKHKIFDKFFQVEEANKQRKTTTGLGLTFCKLVVDAHGGSIWAEDSDKGGAKFVFTIPEALKEAKA
ncbi:MAG: ATP-binding protein [Nitrospirae bacterium]|nr:ATP-binding protein [Nitrospirota bacterium]MCL5978153.1 ATP-binding protein [Nitrospirota bacterium]